MKLKITAKEPIEVEIDTKDLVEEINNMPIKQRWHFIAPLIAMANLNPQELDTENKSILKSFLTSTLKNLD